MQLRRIKPQDIGKQIPPAIDNTTRALVEEIVSDVETNGINAVLSYARKFGDIKNDEPFILRRDELREAFESESTENKKLLTRVAARIRKFAEAQLGALKEMTTKIPGGFAGHQIAQIESAGCYAPGGRYPLPSSVLMTAITASVAGVKNIVVCSPKPTLITKAAAFVAGANMMLSIGGAQGIAALAFGTGEIPRVDIIVGPGNKYVTAAKAIIAGRGLTSIDSLAGPTELMIIADETANPRIVAADLLAQAEHDTVARPILVSTSEELIQHVEIEISQQVPLLKTKDVAIHALTTSGFSVFCDTLKVAIDVANFLAPEHIELHVKDGDQVAKHLRHYGALFIGSASAEVFGDYGFGPNHTLPTSGTSRFSAGLSVFNFIRIRTWMKIDNLTDCQDAVQDSIDLANLEGLVGHAESAKMRLIQHSENKTASVTSNLSKIDRFIRKDLTQIGEYIPVRPLDVLAAELGFDVKDLCKLDANENLYGPPREVVDAVINSSSSFHIYPDPDQTALRNSIANHLSLSASNIVAGAGSDELLDLLFRAFLPKTIITCSPTFSMYRFLAKINQCEVIDVPRKDAPNFDLDIQGIISSIRGGTSLVFIASPNNPTGGTITKEDVVTLCCEESIIVIDEAYAEFSESSALDLVNEFSNLVILRTFSKFAGLAGLRIGYGVMNQKLVSCIMQIKQPYNISVASSVAAQSALEHFSVVSDSIQKIILERTRLYYRLSEFDWLSPCPSQANFVLCKVLDRSAKDVQQYLRMQGILIRCYAGQSQRILDDYIRISVGKPADTDKLMEGISSMHPVGTLSLSVMKRPVAVIFDMDGVLADVSNSYRQTIIDTAASYGVLVTRKQIHEIKLNGNSNNDWLLTYKLLIDRGIDTTLQAVTDKFQSIYSGETGLNRHETLIINREFIYSLSQKCQLAIVTGRPRCEAKEFLTSNKIDTFFSTSVCMEDAPAKPDPAPVLLAIRNLELQEETGNDQLIIYFVGDTPDDIKAGICASSSKLCVKPIGFLPKDGATENHKMAHMMLQFGANRVFFDANNLFSFIFEQFNT